MGTELDIPTPITLDPQIIVEWLRTAYRHLSAEQLQAMYNGWKEELLAIAKARNPAIIRPDFYVDPDFQNLVIELKWLEKIGSPNTHVPFDALANKYR